jgi:pSer/pThr/pTyr-binding forkhead associated (FHA) protein
LIELSTLKYIKNNRFFVRDLDSANHTYLEGKMVKDEMEIVSGNTVRLGEVEFGVEIMPI